MKKKENGRRAKKNNNKGLAFSESEDNLQQKIGSGGEAVPLEKPKKKKICSYTIGEQGRRSL